MGICHSSSKPAGLEQVTAATVHEVTYDFTEAKVLSVYDGDTVTIAAFYDGQFRRFNVRLYGIDCDEMRGGTEQTRKQAQLAKHHVESRVLNKVVDIVVLNNRIVAKKKISEKYGRLLAKISINGVDISQELINMGLAREYYGGKKESD